MLCLDKQYINYRVDRNETVKFLNFRGTQSKLALATEPIFFQASACALHSPSPKKTEIGGVKPRGGSQTAFPQVVTMLYICVMIYSLKEP